MVGIRGNQSKILDSIARNIIEAETAEEKTEILSSFRNMIELKSRNEVLQEKEVLYRRLFTGLVIAIYVTTNVLIGFILIKLFYLDIAQYATENYVRVVDGKVIIALITGVVVQTAASFGILTKYVYGAKSD